MSDSLTPNVKIGGIEWCDLTITNAAEVKDFYCKVVGWNTNPIRGHDFSFRQN